MRIIIFILLSHILLAPLLAQEFTALDPLPKLLEFQWTQGAYNLEGKPLIYKDMLFPNGQVRCYYNAETGLEKNYKDKEPVSSLRRELKDSLIFFDMSDYFYVLNIFNKKLLTNKKRDRDNYLDAIEPVFVQDSLVYTALDKYTLGAVNVFTNKVVWQHYFKEGISFKPVVYKEYLLWHNRESDLFAFNRITGKIAWQLPLGKVISGITIKDDILYLAVYNKGFYAIDLATQKTIWHIPLKETNNGYLLLIDKDRLYFAEGNMFALNRHTGEAIWEADMQGGYIHYIDRIGMTADYLFCYDSGQDSELSFLSAINKNTGKMEYSGWTSEEYPADDEDFNVNVGDTYKYKTISSRDDDYLFVTQGQQVSCYKVKKKAE